MPPARVDFGALRIHQPIVTTNLPFEQWTEVLGSERLTGALLDRVTHRVGLRRKDGEPG